MFEFNYIVIDKITCDTNLSLVSSVIQVRFFYDNLFYIGGVDSKED